MEDDLNRSASRFREHFLNLRQQVGRVVVGQPRLLDELLICVFAGGHALLEGVPGLGKTLLVKALARSLGLDTARIQFTPDLLPQDILGGEVITSRPDGVGAGCSEGITSLIQFRRGPIFSNLVIADEINRSGPKTQSALLEAMEEGQVTLGEKTYVLDDPFMVVATHNPIELEGTYPLPEAQLDRFMMKILVPMPGIRELEEILALEPGAGLASLAPVLDQDEVIGLRRIVRQVTVPSSVRRTIAALVLGTHPGGGEHGRRPAPMVERYVRHGASPRAGQALLAAARVNALLSGRVNVTVGDAVSLCKPVLRHRLILNFTAQTEGINPDEVIEEVLKRSAVQTAGEPGATG